MRNIYIDYFKKASVEVIPPPVYLREYIERYTIYKNYPDNFHDRYFRALPNGKVTLILLLKSNQLVFKNPDSNKGKSAFIMGVCEPDKTHFIKTQSCENVFRGIAVTFTYKGVINFLGLPLIETTNEILDFELFFEEKGQALQEKLNKAENNREIINILNSFFIQNMNQNHYKIPDQLYSILKALNYKHGHLTVENTSQYFKLSYKSLYRLFNSHIGMGPKMFLKIVRFNRACRLLRYKSIYNWSELIYNCGYYDQAHFINEFKSIMKETPHQFLETSKGYFYYNRPFTFKE